MYLGNYIVWLWQLAFLFSQEDVGKAKKVASAKEEEEVEEKAAKERPTQEEFDALQKGVLIIELRSVGFFNLHFFSSELNTANVNLQAMKKQTESTNREYDRLAEEHQKLQVCSEH